MAATKNCSACSDLQENSANFVQNGVTTAVCNSLKNNTGFSPSSGHNDCTDLDNANDCLVGNMEDEVDAYDVCAWKEFMPSFIHNVWTVLKAMICAICGLWKRLEKVECIVSNITQTQTWRVGNDYIVWAPGITQATGANVVEPRITGNAYVGYMTGTVHIDPQWVIDHPESSLNNGGAMLYEYRIPKSLMEQYAIKYIWAGNMQENGAGDNIHCHMYVFRGDDPDNNKIWGYDDREEAHYRGTVPPGAVYIQVRMSSYEGSAVGDTGNTSLSGVMPVLMDTAEFEC